MAQSLPCQLDSIPTSPWWTASAQTPVVAHPEDAKAQRILNVGYYTYTKGFNTLVLHLKMD